MPFYSKRSKEEEFYGPKLQRCSTLSVNDNNKYVRVIYVYITHFNSH